MGPLATGVADLIIKRLACKGVLKRSCFIREVSREEHQELLEIK